MGAKYQSANLEAERIYDNLSFTRLKYGSNLPEENFMEPFQVPPLPESLKPLIPRLANDFRAAISYVAFYPADSSFVTQSVQKLHEDFQKILQCGQPFIIRVENEKLHISDQSLSSFDDLLHLFQKQKITGVEIKNDISVQELTGWLQIIAFSLDEDIKDFEKNQPAHIHLIPKLRGGTTTDSLKEPAMLTLNTFGIFDTLTVRSHPNRKDGFYQNHQALLDFVEESWEFFQTHQKKLEGLLETKDLNEDFDKLFKRLLDRMEKTLPDLKEKTQPV